MCIKYNIEALNDFSKTILAKWLLTGQWLASFASNHRLSFLFVVDISDNAQDLLLLTRPFEHHIRS